MIFLEPQALLNKRKKRLKIFAGLVWYFGAMALALKALKLYGQAFQINGNYFQPFFFMLIGLTAGGIKARYIFINSCRKNIRRIARLNQPKLWQFFSGSFFIFLALMIALGFSLSKLAAGAYYPLLSVAALDTSISSALLFSSFVFWQKYAR